MALRPMKPCVAPGCGALVRGARYCYRHEHLTEQYKAKADERRASSTQRGYGYRWQQVRAGYLRAHPLCAECTRKGRVVVATDLDHITPHKGDMDLFWSRENWQGLCASCHSTKTASEDGGFGNAVR